MKVKMETDLQLLDKAMMQEVTASLAGRAATQQFQVEAASSGQQGEILQLHHY